MIDSSVLPLVMPAWLVSTTFFVATKEVVDTGLRRHDEG